MQDKHTPGPWRIGRNYGAVVADHPVPEMDGSDHVAAYGGHMVGESIAPRNRALIAAAPELHELLLTFTEWARQLAARDDLPKGIRSAAANLHDDGKRLLTKATGSAP